MRHASFVDWDGFCKINFYFIIYCSLVKQREAVAKDPTNYVKLAILKGMEENKTLFLEQNR